MDFPIEFVRGAFPALSDPAVAYFDNGGGTQVPAAVADAVRTHLLERNAQRGAPYRVSLEVDDVVRRTREGLALFVNASDPSEIAFGPNATSFIRIVSLAVGETIEPGDEIVVTELDHEANIGPWLELEKKGAVVKHWPVDAETSRLAIERLDELLTDRTKLVAVTKASNAVGTIVDLIPIAERIHARGGHLFVDAVHFAPHGPMDVQYFGCDFLVCSGYKIFGPHMGFLWGRKALLDALPTFREFFVPDRAPDKLEIGTFNYEAVAGMDAALGYLEELGRRLADLPLPPSEDVGRRAHLRRAMQGIRHYERTLSLHALRRLGDVPRVRLYGIDDPDQAALRTPTLAFNVEGMEPEAVARHLAERGIYVRHGHLYCPRLMKALGIGEKGAVRASLVHYNTFEEVDRLAEALEALA